MSEFSSTQPIAHTFPEADMGETNTGPPPPTHGIAQKDEEAAKMGPSSEVRSGDKLNTGLLPLVSIPNTCRSWTLARGTRKTEAGYRTP